MLASYPLLPGFLLFMPVRIEAGGRRAGSAAARGRWAISEDNYRSGSASLLFRACFSARQLGIAFIGKDEGR